MLFSMNWVRDFVDLSDLDIDALIHRFTLSTAEVEEVIHKGEDIRGVIVAKILSVKEHPRSKKLHLLKVDTGSGVVDCVCGAPNVREGMKVAFATVGGSVGGMEIAERKVADYLSQGMCCSEAELGISADNSGLWELPEELTLGTDIKSIYPIDDVVFEVDNKSLTNRPDLWGHYGVAREFAAMTDRELLPLSKKDISVYSHLPEVDIDVRDTEHAYRYIGVKVENITTHISPVYMRIRLYYCGSRAINFLADLTNYVMMEVGQPMHAFDLRRVDKIEVQRFAEEFDFVTLDHEERRINDKVLMICSHDKPVAIAGIKGGLASGIEDDTTSLLLESATFDGVCIRKAGASLGLRTDSSMRYEKMLDPELAPIATARFLYLLSDIDLGAKVISAVTDKYVYEYPTIQIDIDKAFYDRYTGIDIPTDRIEKTLVALGFGVVRDGDSLSVTVPSWRATKDVTMKADLIEEVTRIYGYDNFEITTSRSPLYPVRPDRAKTDDNRAKDLLVEGYALHEVHSYIWCDAAKYKSLGILLPENPRIINAQTPDHDVLREDLTPTMLSFLAENRGYASRYGVFEIGRTVKGYKENGDVNERKMLSVAICDRNASEQEAFLSVRDMVVTLFRDIKHSVPSFTEAEPKSYMHPANSYAIELDGVVYGFLSVPHPSVKSKLDKKAAFAFAEMDMDLFNALAPRDIRYNEPSRFPGIDIDLSFLCSVSSVNFDTVKALAKEVSEGLLSEVSVVDVYQSENEESLTLRFTFVSAERTLSKSELAPITDAILTALSTLNMKLKEL